MNSLSQLNSLASITFDDQRTPTVIFDRPLPVDQTVTINQNDTHSVPVGINIVDIIVPSLASVSYTIDISSQPNATLTWASIPAGVTVTTPEFGVYTLIGIDSVADWTLLKSPTFTPDPTFTGIFSYIATISWAGGSRSWTINTNILDITNMTTADDVYFDKNDTGIIAGNPEILDNYVTTWTVTVTPSNVNYVSSLSSAGSGGTSSFNATTKVLTITGTKTQVNTHLNSISYTITNSATLDFTLGYIAVNDTTNEGDYKVQNWYSTEYLAATRANDSYSLNTQAAITNGPLITDADYDGSGTYIMTITPTVPAAVYAMESQGKYYWAGGTSVTAPSGGYLESHHSQTSDLSKYAVSNSTVNSNGAVYLYTRSGTTLTLSNTLTGDYTGVNAEFGQHFSANSDLTKFAIAAPGEDGSVSPATDRGAIYIMNSDGSSKTRKASPSSTDYFRAAKINPTGDSVAVYAYSGSDAWVYIYDLSGSTWSLTNSFQGVTNEFAKPSSDYYDQRGMVFVDDTTLVVTDRRESSNKGSVSIYKKSAGLWSLNVKLTQPTELIDSYFGQRIKVNSSTQIEIWAEAPDLTQSYRKHIYSLISGTWTFVSTTVVSYAGGDSAAPLPYTTTSDGEFKVIASEVYRNPGSGFDNYSTLSTSSDVGFAAVISANGEYIVGHRSASSTLKYLKAFVKTADDPQASSWDNATKTLTLQGTREFINSEIDTILMTPETGYNTNITLTYTLTTPRGNSDSRTQTITYTP